MTDQERFDRCLPEILHHEGGWSDHPSDPGGATMKGVTQTVYDAYRARKGLALQSVRHIADEELSEIYRDGYWKAAACDKLPAGVDLMVFDCAVNMGASRARKYLQQAVGCTPDGDIGPKTLAAAERIDPAAIISLIYSRRAAFYRASANYPTFGKGWIRRLNEVRAKAEGWL